MSTDDYPMRLVTATCHTEGCPNAEVPIVVSVPDTPTPSVVCGVCGQPITDIPALREEGEVAPR